MNLQQAHVIYHPMYFGLNTGASNLCLLNWQADALPSEWTGTRRARPSFSNANIHILESSFIFQALRWCLLRTWKLSIPGGFTWVPLLLTWRHVNQRWVTCLSIPGTIHTQLDVQVVEMEQQVSKRWPVLVYKIFEKEKKKFHGILQARILEWVAIPFPRGSSRPRGSNPGLPHCRRILYQLSSHGSPENISNAPPNAYLVKGCVSLRICVFACFTF